MKRYQLLDQAQGYLLRRLEAEPDSRCGERAVAYYLEAATGEPAPPSPEASR